MLLVFLAFCFLYIIKSKMHDQFLFISQTTVIFFEWKVTKYKFLSFLDVLKFSVKTAIKI